MKTNKEIIDELEQYFLTQDPRDICRTLAAMLIDMNRLYNVNLLPKAEKANLMARIKANSESVREFSKNGPKGNFKNINIET